MSSMFCPGMFRPVYFVRYVLFGYILSGTFCPGIYCLVMQIIRATQLQALQSNNHDNSLRSCGPPQW